MTFILSICGFMPAQEKYPQIISHRGACGYVPEHSLAAYQLAIDLGTDYIEPDLCITQDGKLKYIYLIYRIICLFFTLPIKFVKFLYLFIIFFIFLLYFINSIFIHLL